MPVATVTLDKIGTFLELDFRRLFVWLRSGLLLAFLLAIVGAIVGGAYSMLGKQLYTVTTDILINPANLQVIQNDLYPQSGQVDGQILTTRSKQRILTSGSVLSGVVDELELYNDPEFFDASRSAGKADAPKADPKLAAQKSLALKVKTSGDERSFVTTLTVSAQTPEKAVKISQSIVKHFQEELASAELPAPVAPPPPSIRAWASSKATCRPPKRRSRPTAAATACPPATVSSSARRR
ncbi:Wzz/FepE/Etk N-terminal domain-containing protein [Mesorhizobium amorphae]|uniref:Wzz/FepE/Etk N-terminal domain-containing protein n=1 Tax=Mesorhizobium amorphae TaxID=71433 RepID=UPI0021B47601|nr:Wzz/FepE/Etk N-terminal domain-containing protein [Mesorhizobium amorphae]